MNEWLKVEGVSGESEVLEDAPRVRSGELAAAPSLAIFLSSLVVRDTRKWFGDAELRLDALVVHGGGERDFYEPKTFRFPRVADGDDLAGPDPGLLIYLGKPVRFLAMSLMLARDTKDSDDLATLLKGSAGSSEFQATAGAMAAMAIPSAEAAAVQAGLRAAVALGEFAYSLIRKTSPSCLGLYRASWLGNKHKFGVGKHPRSGTHEVKDFEVSYSIELDA